MLHDVSYMSEVRFIRAAGRIFDHYQEEFYDRIQRNDRVMIAIGGESGTGKTSIACILSQMINQDPRCSPSMVAKHVCADDLYLGNYCGQKPGLREIARQNACFEGIGPDEYNWNEQISSYDSISRVVSAFRGEQQEKTCRIPCVDVLNQQIDELKIDFSQEIGILAAHPKGSVQKECTVNMLIMEGLYAIDPRMRADYHFLLGENYFRDKPWSALRPSEFDCMTFTECITKGDGVGRIQQYAQDVIRSIGDSQLQDGSGKENLSERRIIIMELEHQALQKVRRDLELRVATGECTRFATILLGVDDAVIAWPRAEAPGRHRLERKETAHEGMR